MHLVASDPKILLEWLSQHIPHRVRTALSGTELLVKLLQARYGVQNVRTAGLQVHLEKPADFVALACASNAIWEGRLVATRWLIEFIGIKADPTTELPKQNKKDPRRATFDLHIEDLRPGTYLPITDPGAYTLAKVWIGCTRASSHPTYNSNHPPG